MMVNEAEQPISVASVLKGSATALAIKFGASLLAFAMFALASREMGPEVFGAFAIAFNALSFLAVIALCGQETLVVRSWGEYCGSNRHGLARGVVTFAGFVIAGATLAMVIVVAIGWHALAPVPLPLLLAGLAFLFTYAVLMFTTQLTRVVGGVVVADGPGEVVWRAIVAVVLGASYLLNIGFTAVEFFFTAAAALAVSILFQALLIVRLIPDAVWKIGSERTIGAWLHRSFKMWLSTVLDNTGQYLEIVIVGAFLGPTAAGIYFVLMRIANFFAMISAGISKYATSQIGALYYSNASTELQMMLRSLALIALAVVGGGVAAVVIAGKLLLLAFGPAYVDAYTLLIVLTFGAAILTLAGPAQHLLLLTGHEGAYPRVMAVALLIRFLLIAILGPQFGLVGAVIAWTLSVLFLAAALVVTCRRLLGLDPSLFSVLVGKRQQVSLKGGVL
jgi:O-antigen/teichoic acid export membrane protein